MKRILSRFGSVLFLLFILLSVGAGAVLAAPFTRANLRYDRMMTGKLSSLQVSIVPASVGTEAKVVLVFASASVSIGQSASITGIPTGQTALPGIGTTAVGAGTSIAVPCSDLTVGTTYAYNITIGVTTPAAGTYLDKIQTLGFG
jgi:hypothetical protein